MKRRNFLKKASVAGAAAVVGVPLVVEALSDPKGKVLHSQIWDYPLTTEECQFYYNGVGDHIDTGLKRGEPLFESVVKLGGKRKGSYLFEIG